MPNLRNAHFPFREEVHAMDSRTLRENATEFINYKRSIGYAYEAQECLLNRYVQFAGARTSSPVPVKDTTDGFLSSLTGSPGTLYQMAAVLREFSRYLLARGFKESYVIPPKTASQPAAENPYFFTEKEVDAFFEKLDAIKPNSSFRGREIVLPALFRLLYCCGLRCKEVRTLLRVNVHTQDHYIDVIQSKGPKSRRIFISHELAGCLADYDVRIGILFPGREYYFPSSTGGCCSSLFVSSNFRRFWLEASPDFEMATRPRAYDFRHHFAWSNLNRWAAEGLDLNVMLPYLMRYMGHQSVSGTLYYFHFVPEFFPTYKSMTDALEDVIPEVSYEE